MASCAAADASLWTQVSSRYRVRCRYPEIKKKKKKEEIQSDKSRRLRVLKLYPQSSLSWMEPELLCIIKREEAYLAPGLVRLRVIQFFHVRSALHVISAPLTGAEASATPFLALFASLVLCGGERLQWPDVNPMRDKGERACV